MRKSRILYAICLWYLLFLSIPGNLLGVALQNTFSLCNAPRGDGVLTGLGNRNDVQIDYMHRFKGGGAYILMEEQ